MSLWMDLPLASFDEPRRESEVFNAKILQKCYVIH
jgi:hypothetical protein